MKKLLLVCLVIFTNLNLFSQLYYLNSSTNGTTINACKGQFVASGYSSGTFIGSSSGYGNNQDYTVTICSSTGGQIRANFYWIDLETNYDYLYVYDGTSTASPLLATLNGSQSYPGVYTSSGSCLTFRFKSDGGTRWGGWNALLGCAPQNCGSNPVASDNCGSAPIICNLNGYCGSTSGWFTRDNGNIEGDDWGGSNVFSCGSIQNNSWISFVASATTANFNITSSNCSNASSGIQAIVLATSACTSFTAKSTCVGNGIGTFALNATGLTVGQTYYIMIDGVDGNDCEYSVQATSGVQTVNINTSATGPICPGTNFTLTASATGTGPFSYNWIPAPVSGQGTQNAVYTASSGTTYSCVITGACGSSQTAVFSQPVTPRPTLTVSSPTTICAGGSGVNLTANGNSGASTISFQNNSTTPIPDNNSTGITSNISVSGIPGTVGSNLVSVCLNIDHGFTGDLDISLRCPDGTIIDLSSDNGGGGDNYSNTCFVPTGSPITGGTAPFSGSYVPEQPFSNLSGCTINGTWSLIVKDDASLDVGTLLNWTITFNNNVTYSWSPSTGLSSTTSSVVTANPSTSTTYSVIVTNQAGCTSTVATIPVTVNPQPTVAINSTPTSTMCLGSSITFTAATASTYTWTASTGGGLSSTSGSNVGATPSSTGIKTYTVNATSALGCTNTAVRTITVNATPTANAGSSNTLTCISTTLNLSGSGGGTYAWTGPGIVSGGTSATPVVNQPGTYSLAVTSASGCTSPISTVSISQNTVVPVVTSTVSGILNCTLTSVNAVANTTTTPVSYNWNGTGITSGASTASASINQPGTFNYTVTNTNNGCRTTGSQAVTQNTTAPTLTVSPTQTITCAAPTVTITGVASPTTSIPNWLGGVATGANSYTATVGSANTYSLSVTNPANGCTALQSVQVLPSPGFPELTNALISNSITCNTFTAQAVVTSTTSNISYNWSGPGIVSGANTPSIIVNSGGTYSLAVTNTISMCTSSTTAFVPTNTLTPSPNASNTTTLTCTTTTASLIGSPSTGVTYQWSGPSLSGPTTNSTAIASSPGTYTLRVTNSVNGCTNTATTILTQNIIPPNPTASNATTLTCLTTSATLIGGPASGVTYQWSGPSLSAPLTNSTVVANGPGTYTLLVTDAVNGCTNTATTILTQNIVAPSPTASSSTSLTCLTTTATLTGGPSSGVTYEWSGPDVLGSNTNSIVTAGSPGTYSLIVTSAVNGCTNIATTNLLQNITLPSPTINNTTTLTCLTTSATLTGGPSSGVTYLWTGPSIVGTATNSTIVANGPGIYTLQVTDNINGCVNIATNNLIQNITAPDPTAVNNTTLTCTILTATITGGPSSGVSYSWSGPYPVGSTTNQNLVVDGAGIYALTVTDLINGCSNTTQIPVFQEITSPTVSITPPSTITCSSPTVNVSASTSANTTYTWSGPGILTSTNASSINVNQPGNYNIVVMNTVSNCTISANALVEQDIVTPSVTASATGSLNCSVLSINASATTTVTPVTYNWSGLGITSGSGTGTVSVNQGGTYNYTVTNTNNGCVNSGSLAVIQNTVLPIVNASNSGSLNCSVTSVNVIASTTTSPISYNWSGPGITSGAGTGTISVNAGGTYNYTTTNTFNNCSTSGSVAVVQNTITPTVNSSSTGSLNCNVTSVNISATSTTTPISYNWSGPSITSGAGTGTISVNEPGNYNYTVTNTFNNCVTNGTVAITQNTVIPTITMPATQTITCAAPTVTLIASANPSTATPVWNGGVTSGSNSYTATAASANIYTLTVTNPFNMCVNSATTEVIPSPGFPVVNTSSSNSITCVNLTADVIATTTTSPVSFNWNGPGIVSGANTATASINSGGVYTVVVTNTISVCSTTITLNVPSSTVAITPTASVTGSITCSTPSLTLNSLPSSGVTYTWTGSGIISPSNQQNIDVNTGDTYSLSITNTTDGCVGSTTVFVPTNTTIPTVNLSLNNYTTTCATPSVQFNASSTPSTNIDYSWTVPTTGTLDANNISNPIATGSGIFTVSITDNINGCVTSSALQGTVEVISDQDSPIINASPNTLIITCTNTLVSSTITSTNTTLSYTWNPAPFNGINSATADFNSVGAYDVSVMASNGCTAIATVSVTIDNTVPDVTLSAASNSGTLTCLTNSITITPTITPNSNLTYSWSPSSGISGASDQASATFTAPGIYSISVTNTVNGCVSSSTNTATTFTVIEDVVTPTININPSSTNTVIGCSASVVDYSVSISGTSGTNINYSWSNGATTPTTGITSSGVYSVTVTNADNGCFSTSQFTVVGNTTPPQNVNAGTNVDIACGSNSVALNGTSTSTNVTYSWTGPSSTSILSGNNTANPVVSETGIYTLTVTDALTGCQSSSTVSVVQGNVIAGFTTNINEGIAPLEINFTDTSSGGNVFIWNFGDGNTSTNQNPINTYTAGGTYTVELIVSSGLCSDTAYTIIIVQDGLSLEIPNVFTPNNDGSNDIFMLRSTGIKEISLQIFNRWGTKLYDFIGPKAAWDGKSNNGENVPEGTYFFFVKALGYDGKEIEKNGTVHLFR